MALGLVGLAGSVHAGTYSSLGAFETSTRGDLFFQSFGGAISTNYPSPSFGGNGFSCVVAAVGSGGGHLRRDSHGIGTESSGDEGVVGFLAGKSVTAFAGTFILEDTSGNPIAGSMVISTDTGAAFTISVPAAGVFFGFTASQPFTTVVYNAVGAGTNEMVDNIYVGTAVQAVIPTSQCDDAPTVGAGSYHFDTSGAAYDGLPRSCANENSSPCLYFRYIPPNTGTSTIHTCGCNYDSVLRVLDGCGGNDLACNDDACAVSTGQSYASRLQLRTTAGQPLLIRVSGYSLASGSGVLTITATADCPGDFNHDAATNVQDIFDFLSAWFQGCP